MTIFNRFDVFSNSADLMHLVNQITGIAKGFIIFISGINALLLFMH